MKAIIIEEDRFVEIRELLELEAMKLKESFAFQSTGASKQVWEAAVTEVYRSMNYHFVTWAQSHGASCVRV